MIVNASHVVECHQAELDMIIDKIYDSGRIITNISYSRDNRMCYISVITPFIKENNDAVS